MIIQFVKLGGSLRRCLAVWSDYCMKLWSVLSHWISSLMLIVKVGNCWWYQSLSWLNTFNGFTGDQLNKADWNNNGGIFQISPQFKHLHSEKNRVVLNRSQHPQGLIWVKYIGWYFVWQYYKFAMQWRGNCCYGGAGQWTGDRRFTICSQCKCIEREWLSLA